MDQKIVQDKEEAFGRMEILTPIKAESNEDVIAQAGMIPVGPGPIRHRQYSYVIRGQRYKMVYYEGPELSRNGAINKVREYGRDNNQFCHVWNDTMYWRELNLTDRSYILMGVYNVDSEEVEGWTAILRTETKWMFYKNNEWVWVREPNHSKFVSVPIDNSYLTLFVKNPRNADGWTSADIIYRYGWSFT